MLGEMRLLLQLQSSVTKLIQNIDSVIFYCNSTLVVDTTTDLIMSITATIKLLIFNFI
jgi:putative hemolysin